MKVKTKIEVREVLTKSELRKFVDYPNQLYRDVPQFVPAFYGDDMADWNKKKNPAFSYCDAKCWLAWRDGEIVGRIGAILSHKANEKWGTNRMRFTQVDFIDDEDVSAALFETVENWAREQGCEQVHGPLGFTDMDREGMLVEGFDRRSMFITYYNHPYYNDHLAALGYVKDVDWIENLITVPPADGQQAKRLARISQHVLKKGNYHKAEVKSRLQYKPYIEKVFELANRAYSHLYGMVELNEEQVKKYATKFIPLIDPELACFVMDENEKMIAFGVSAPSMAEAMKKSRGRLFPTGWARVLRSLKHNDTVDLFLVAVDPDHQGSGVNAVLMEHVLQGANRKGIKVAETGPMLESNSKIQAQWKLFDLEQHKRRRCYIKDLV